MSHGNFNSFGEFYPEFKRVFSKKILILFMIIIIKLDIINNSQVNSKNE